MSQKGTKGKVTTKCKAPNNSEATMTTTQQQQKRKVQSTKQSKYKNAKYKKVQSTKSTNLDKKVVSALPQKEVDWFAFVSLRNFPPNSLNFP